MFLTTSYMYLCSLLVLVSSQDECERLLIADLGSTDAADTTGLISEILTPGGESPQNRQPTVTVLDMNIICEAQSVTQDHFRYTSAVATFTCFSLDARITECQDRNVINTQQFDLGCLDGNWKRLILTVSTSAQTPNPPATLTTEKESRCSYCLNPIHPVVELLNWTVSADTHCRRCSNCTTGFQRCYIGEAFTEVCCNYFHQGGCVTECPHPLVPVNFDCQIIDCGGLMRPANGTVLLSSGTTYSSSSHYECDIGFTLQGEAQRTCAITGMWSGYTPNCSLCNTLIPNCKECVSLHNSSVNCTMCSSGFNNVGTECIRESIGCDINCILGITLSLLCLFVISGVIVVSIERSRNTKHIPSSLDSSTVSPSNRALKAIEPIVYDDVLTVQEVAALESEYEVVDVEPIYDYPLGEDRSNAAFNLVHPLTILTTADNSAYNHRGEQMSTTANQPWNDEELNTSANVAYTCSK